MAICALLYGSFAYQLVRHDFIKLLTLYFGLFGLTYILLKQTFTQWKLLLIVGILYRLIFLWAIPNLSQDFYRFIWDGQVLLNGGNPFEFTPLAYSGNPASYGIEIQHVNELLAGMGELNASHHSNYPPLKQLFFALSVLLGGKSIMGSMIALRLLLILADMGIFWIGRKLLLAFDQPPQRIFWYFLNPFVIIELTGNLHFEGVMIFCLMASLYLLYRGSWFWSAILMGASISIKLIPLLLLPLLLRWFINKEKQSWVTLIGYYLTVGGFVVMTFLPFLSQKVILQYYDTTALWFQNFEFNASVYYVVRYFGFEQVGYNIIESAGKVLAVIIFILIMAMAFFRKNEKYEVLLKSMVFAFTIYFLLSTTVHPWYITTPLILGILAGWRYPLLWSFLVVLSYSGYQEDVVNEKLWILAVEYLLLLLYLLWELKILFPKKRIPFQDWQNI